MYCYYRYDDYEHYCYYCYCYCCYYSPPHSQEVEQGSPLVLVVAELKHMTHVIERPHLYPYLYMWIASVALELARSICMS